jgi:hypothetical protein
MGYFLGSAVRPSENNLLEMRTIRLMNYLAAHVSVYAPSPSNIATQLLCKHVCATGTHGTTEELLVSMRS